MENIFIKTKDETILYNLFPNCDIVSIDEILNKLNELNYEINELKDELEKGKNKEPEEEDKYEDYKLGLL